MRKILILAVIAISIGSYWYFGQNKDIVTPPVLPPAASISTISEAKVFTLEAGSYYYKPNVITVKKGENVKVIINSVSMMHDFVIDEIQVNSAVAKSGTSTEVEFVADKIGSFEFYCSIGSHRKMGMVGTLVVSE